jgi:hypothetical protein
LEPRVLFTVRREPRGRNGLVGACIATGQPLALRSAGGDPGGAVCTGLCPVSAGGLIQLLHQAVEWAGLVSPQLPRVFRSAAESRACSRVQQGPGRVGRQAAQGKIRLTPHQIHACFKAICQNVGGFGAQTRVLFQQPLNRPSLLADGAEPAAAAAIGLEPSPALWFPGVPRLAVSPAGRSHRGGCCRDRAGRRTAANRNPVKAIGLQPGSANKPCGAAGLRRDSPPPLELLLQATLPEPAHKAKPPKAAPGHRSAPGLCRALG